MKEKRITSIDLWKFLLVLGIIINNINNLLWQGKGVNLIFTGAVFISFFMFISGYYLMDYYKKDKSKKEASLRTWEYIKKRFSKLYPALLGGVFLAFVVRNIILKTSITKIFMILMNSFWEFIGLSQIGISPTNTGIIGLWNEPLWYISALLISSLILYYLVSKNEDFFRGLFAPVFIIITYTLIGNKQDLNMFLSLIRVMAGLSIGMLLYYVVEYFKKKKFSETMMMTFSIMHIVLAMFLIYTSFKGITWNNYAQGFLILIFCLVLLVNKDYVAILYNDSNICAFLGKLTLYIYACHIAYVYLLSALFPTMGYHASLIFNLLFSSCWAFIMMYVDDYVISPIFRKKFFLK